MPVDATAAGRHRRLATRRNLRSHSLGHHSGRGWSGFHWRKARKNPATRADKRDACRVAACAIGALGAAVAGAAAKWRSREPTRHATHRSHFELSPAGAFEWTTALSSDRSLLCIEDAGRLAEKLGTELRSRSP